MKRLETIGYQLPVVPWLSDNPSLVHAVSEQLFIVLCIALGQLAPCHAVASASLHLLNFSHLSDPLKAVTSVRHPEFVAVVLRVLKRCFLSPAAPSMLSEVTESASGDRVAKQSRLSHLGVAGVLRGMNNVSVSASATPNTPGSTPSTGVNTPNLLLTSRPLSYDGRRRRYAVVTVSMTFMFY